MLYGITARADRTLRPTQGNRKIQAGLWIGEVSDGFLKSGRQLGLVGHRIPLVDNAILAEIIY